MSVLMSRYVYWYRTVLVPVYHTMGYGQLSIDTVASSSRYLDIVTYMSVYDIVDYFMLI